MVAPKAGLRVGFPPLGGRDPHTAPCVLRFFVAPRLALNPDSLFLRWVLVTHDRSIFKRNSAEQGMGSLFRFRAVSKLVTYPELMIDGKFNLLYI